MARPPVVISAEQDDVHEQRRKLVPLLNKEKGELKLAFERERYLHEESCRMWRDEIQSHLETLSRFARVKRERDELAEERNQLLIEKRDLQLFAEELVVERVPKKKQVVIDLVE